MPTLTDKVTSKTKDKVTSKTKDKVTSKTKDKVTSKTKDKVTSKTKVTLKTKDKLMFILFPGHGNSEKDWNWDYDKKIPISEINFTSTLKKLGKICYISFPWNNIFYYYDKEGPSRFTDDLNFYISDFDVKAYCKKVFTEIKDFKGKFVPIGHSIGALYAHTFAELYPKRCAFSVCIDGSFLTNIWDVQDKSIKSHLKYSDDDLIKFKMKVVQGNKNAINKLSVISSSNIYNSIYRFKKNYSNIKLKVKNLSFFNLDTSNDPIPIQLNVMKIKESTEMKRFNGAKYECIFFVDKTHWPHWNKDSREIILDIIKKNINGID